ncbi:MAG: acyclic terpene utilization AtuA family protein, partial [Betaproteobacteria bacterium]|nr:acyclic terpene utilization AtuA family protein [Betaproteobacteria bacterium]
KPVQGLGRLGFPIAEVQADGSAVITKLAGSGGSVNAQTCKEQILYEVHDPSRYIQADVVADFSRVRVEEIAHDRVRVDGAWGSERTGMYKVSVGFRDRYMAEGMMSYAGAGAQARAELAAEIVKERLALRGIWPEEIRYELIGINALHGHLGDGALGQSATATGRFTPYELRLRVAAACASEAMAWDIVNEVETLYTNGPAGGGGAHRLVKEVIGVLSCLIPETAVQTQSYWFGDQAGDSAATNKAHDASESQGFAESIKERAGSA